MNEQKIIEIVKKDPWMMRILTVARDMNLPDWMIGAGFLRNKVWDYLHGYNNKEVPTSDIDLIFYDPDDISESKEELLNQLLREKLRVNWSVKNQARMHAKHAKTEPYKNSEEALAEWVETPTCVAVRLEKDDSLTLFAPHGIEDLVNLVVRPAPASINNLELFWDRVKSKGWEKKWPKLIIRTK